MVTSLDIARLVGVSQPTISRALRDDPRVSKATKERVKEAARLLGYVPSATGRALALGRSQRVGVVLTDVENAFYPHLIGPLRDGLHSAGYDMVLLAEQDDEDVAKHVASNGLDGVLLTTETLDSTVPIRLRDRNIPFVYVNRVVPSVEADAVEVDSSPGYAELADQLKRLGHRVVGAIFGPEVTTTGLVRERVMRDSLAAAGIAIDPAACRRGAFDVEIGRRNMLSILDSGSSATAVLCGNDVIAAGALSAAAQRGVGVPDQLSVVGFDDLPFAAWPMMDLATVAFDIAAMGAVAAQLLVERIERPAAGFRREVLGTRLVPRGSLGAVTVSHSTA